jgi:prepilin-type N-terminal cleavage/methylation domain-containing protein
MTARRACHRGFTLAELMVVVMILGVMAAVTGIAFATRAPIPITDARLARIATARDSAVRSGQSATIAIDVDSVLYVVTAFPDGRVVTDAPLRVARLSGRGDREGR